jgi:3-(3-hydroxy-phenyl)propionate hydroxylase
MRAIRVLPPGRALFDDLKVKPENTFDAGLFWRDKHAERLRAGSTLPQGWVRTTTNRDPILSDEVLGLHWALIGVGVDPTPYLRSAQLQRWYRAGGKLWQWCQRSQAQHLAAPAHRLEALDEALLPLRAPLGWVVIVRPDRCVMAEAPVEQVGRMLEEALARIAPADDAVAAAIGARAPVGVTGAA